MENQFWILEAEREKLEVRFTLCTGCTKTAKRINVVLI